MELQQTLQLQQIRKEVKSKKNTTLITFSYFYHVLGFCIEYKQQSCNNQ